MWTAPTAPTAAGGSFSLEEGGVIDSQGLVNLLESFCPHRDMRVKSNYYYDPQSGNVFLDMVSKIDPPYRYEPEPSVAYEGMKLSSFLALRRVV